jgi:hypothetical protein
MVKQNRKGKMKSNGLAKRVKILEQKQAADDKNTEFKVAYYSLQQTMDDSWASNSGMAPRITHGTGAENAASGTAGAIRIGNEVNLRHWSLEGYIALPKDVSGSVIEPNSQVPCRVLLVDNLTDDSALAITDVLQNPLSSVQSVLSPYKNSANASKRYKVYADYKFTLTREKDKRISFRMPLSKSGRILHYANGSASTPSDFNMTLLMYAQTSVTEDNQPTFDYIIKSRFTDA